MKTFFKASNLPEIILVIGGLLTILTLLVGGFKIGIPFALITAIGFYTSKGLYQETQVTFPSGNYVAKEVGGKLIDVLGPGIYYDLNLGRNSVKHTAVLKKDEEVTDIMVPFQWGDGADGFMQVSTRLSFTGKSGAKEFFEEYGIKRHAEEKEFVDTVITKVQKAVETRAAKFNGLGIDGLQTTDAKAKDFNGKLFKNKDFGEFGVTAKISMTDLKWSPEIEDLTRSVAQDNKLRRKVAALREAGIEQKYINLIITADQTGSKPFIIDPGVLKIVEPIAKMFGGRK